MDLEGRAAGTMKMVGGRLCFDFVNTVGGRIYDEPGRRPFAESFVIRADKLNEYDDLLAWGRSAGVLNEDEVRKLGRESSRHPDEAAAVLARARALREALYQLFKATMRQAAPRAIDLEVVNEELAAARRHERLVGDGGGYAWASVEPVKALDRVLFAVARSAAEYLTTGDPSRLRECGSDDCHWLFEDTSKNRSRQWCDMKDCGNLAKVRRFRTRLRDAG